VLVPVGVAVSVGVAVAVDVDGGVAVAVGTAEAVAVQSKVPVSQGNGSVMDILKTPAAVPSLANEPLNSNSPGILNPKLPPTMSRGVGNGFGPVNSQRSPGTS
jgi:hypothetical protein